MLKQNLAMGIIIVLLPLFLISEEITNVVNNTRSRVIVSTDIGGTDPDDFQSMVHFLVYADRFDIEGLIASPYGPGRKQDILDVINKYEKDYANLKTYSDDYPTPDALREITKQGAIKRPGRSGFSNSTEASDWIVQCTRRDDPRPLYILVWGGIEDLAQALRDAPDIAPKLRVYWIGGPNKKWSFDAYQYIASHHKELWIIENNAAYRGWFNGGNQEGEWGNESFVTEHIAGHGVLGDFFKQQLGGIKMGDTPSVAYLLHGEPEDPSTPSWGGRFVKAWKRPRKVFHRVTNSTDVIEQFGIVELMLPVESDLPAEPEATIEIVNQKLAGKIKGDSLVHFRVCPKKPGEFNYTIHSNIASLDGKSGSFTSFLTPADKSYETASDLPNWWTDDPSEELREGEHIGAKTINQWRMEFLSDFTKRMDRCKSPKNK